MDYPQTYDELRQRVAELEEKNQNLFNALMASTQQNDNLYKSIKAAVGHLNLYGLFSCVEGDSYDQECADNNVRKALSILKSELTTDILMPAGKDDPANYSMRNVCNNTEGNAKWQPVTKNSG